MSNNSTSRVRRSLPNSRTGISAATMEFVGRRDVWSKFLLCGLTSIVLWLLAFGWNPAFPYRTRQAPLRDMYARASFEFLDTQKTDEARTRARREINCYYENDRQVLVDLRGQLIVDVFEVMQESIQQVKDDVWSKFLAEPDVSDIDIDDPTSELNKFREAWKNDEALETLRKVIDKAFLEIDENGLLTNLEHELEDGRLEEIKVYNKGTPNDWKLVPVSNVRIAEISERLKSNLRLELQNEPSISDPFLVADRLFDWLRPQLPSTLKLDPDKTEKDRELSVDSVEPEMKKYEPGTPLDKKFEDAGRSVIRCRVPLDGDDIALLRAEHDEMVKSMTVAQHFARSCLFLGTFLVIFSLLCSYLRHRDQNLLDDFKHFSMLVGLSGATFLLGWILAANEDLRAEIIPFMICAMIIAIAYNTELAIFLSSLIALAFTILHGYGVGEFVILAAATCTSAMLCGTIRSRTKLVYIGMICAIITFPIVIGIHSLLGQPITRELLRDGMWYAGSAALAGLFITVLLPFIEQWFDIQTDISLLELGDANHPLLKQLVQTAPGTYNHSINVASISETAAKSIGANGLLCRVGAYFHDVGKVRKPEYFIENQSGGENKHDDLEPTMSTIVIIAHVKDGAEMGRQHKLPQRIIDLIEQHHGTTVVEFFYNRAKAQLEGDENAQPVDRDSFRYPGPKPQTSEAAILMLADSVESASRALREPAPSRIESLVQTILKHKLNDGQLDECPITFQQLHTIEESMIKSLNAMYHGRVKYPEQSQDKEKPTEKQLA